MPIKVRDNADEHRYEALVDGEVAAFAVYHSRPGLIAIVHTEVADEFEGQGIASALAEEALKDARRRKLEVLPFCPFLNAYIERHPEYLDLVPKNRREAFEL